MNAVSLIYRKITTAEFNAISEIVVQQNGGGQTYIDFPKGSISDDELNEFFGYGVPITASGYTGFRWNFQVHSLSLDSIQNAEISVRRAASNSLRNQTFGSRISIFEPKNGFPKEKYDPNNNAIIIYILKDEMNGYWAGWFYRNQYTSDWFLTLGLSTLFYKDCAYVKFDKPIQFDHTNREWPFMGIEGNKRHFKKITQNDPPELIIQRFHQYLAAIRTKPFLLLAGISGTGKSQIVKEMAFSTCPDIDNLRDNEVSPGNYCLIEVKPNWHDSTELLGYDSVIKGHYVVTKFVKFVVKAMRYPDVPFFVCLDEMNLAPVEQYFAEFLSVLESRKLVDGIIVSAPLIEKECFQKDIVAYELFNLALPKTGEMQIKNASLSDADLDDYAEIWHNLQKEGLCIPQNLIVIGTVNMDETTHQFSRKVIDRAMTFEMNEANFDSYFEDKVTLNYVDETLNASLFFARDVSGNKAMEEFNSLDQKFKENVSILLNDLNEVLNDTPFKIAYRVQNELILYYTELLHENTDANLATALDDIMMMKVLPRIEGDDELLGNRSSGALRNLMDFAEQHNLTKSIDKIEEMLKRLERSHFTSFWP